MRLIRQGQAQLADQQEQLLSDVKEAFYVLYQKHATGRVMDDRQRTQLRLACLAAATHNQLAGAGQRTRLHYFLLAGLPAALHCATSEASTL